MLPVLSSQQIQEQDRLTMEQEPISSLDLMERASSRLVEALLRKEKFQTVCVVCGPGNNGGDGLVAARLLHHAGKTVRVLCPSHDNVSSDFKTNRERLAIPIIPLESLQTEITAELYIDALFGTGLDREVQGVYSVLIQWLNQGNKRILAIDMPSGMPHAPAWKLNISNCVQADEVYTFQYPKLSLLLPYAAGFAEHFEVLDIGLLPFEGVPNYSWIERSDAAQLMHRPMRFAHKYQKGCALIVGGSKGMSGSVVLSAEAALRAGSGLVKVLIPEVVLAGLQQRLPEAMYILGGKSFVTSFDVDLSKIDALGVGPGMGTQCDKDAFVMHVLCANKPLVLDADALRLIAYHELHDQLPANCILTPHEGEFKALVGNWSSEQEKLDKLKSYCETYRVIVVLKGAHTLVSDGTKRVFNSTGNPAMATAGSGDVLLGIITSLLAQAYPPWDAACLGVYLHGLAGDTYCAQHQSQSLIASDLSALLGSIMAQLLVE